MWSSTDHERLIYGHLYVNNAIFLLACLTEDGTGKRLLLNLSVYTMSKIALSKSVKKFVNSV